MTTDRYLLMADIEEKKIKTSDGQEIIARFFSPQPPMTCAVLIVPGIGMRQEYYSSIAAWFANQGCLVATFDFRGTGLSLTGTLRGYKANILDWAQKDAVAVLDELARLSQGKPIYWLGHSLGGQIVGLVPNISKVSKIITIAAGSGYWRENAPQLKKNVLWMWYMAVPLSITVLGYFPGKKLRMVGDLPKGVILQWRRWCLNSNYLMGAEGTEVIKAYEQLTIPILALAIEDDELISLQSIKSLHRFYQSAPNSILEVIPKQHGLQRIGHIGFFKPELAQLWDYYLLPELQDVIPRPATSAG